MIKIKKISEAKLYHGSKIRFNRFDLNYAYSGVGVNTYGYGIYLTDRYDVAKNYATSYSEVLPIVTIDKKEVSSEFIRKMVSTIINTHGKKKEVLLMALRANIKTWLELNKITQPESDMIMRANTIKVVMPQFIYEIELDLDRYYIVDIKRHIDWDKIISLKAELDKINYKGRVEFDMSNKKIIYHWGGTREYDSSLDLYRMLAGDKNMSQQKVSIIFDKAGINGFYSERTDTYIIFNPDILEIKKVKNI